MPAVVPSIFENSIESAICHECAPYRAETVGKERFLQDIADRARRAATAKAPGSRHLMKRFGCNRRHLAIVCRSLAELCAREQAMPSGSEWLLDNQYVIDAIVKEVETDLPHQYYQELPALQYGKLKGFPRIYELAIALLAHADSSLNEGILGEATEKYQELTPLTIGELWALPTMLRLGLLENLRRLADRVRMQVNDSRAAQDAIQKALSNQIPTLPAHPSSSYSTSIWELLRENDLPEGEASARLRAWSNEHLVEMAHIQHAEFCLQAADQVSIGNAITSLRLLSVIDWSKFVESLSLVERVLRQDTVYAQQDFTTRNQSRHVIEQLAKRNGRHEITIAQAAIALAHDNITHAVQGHVGYWLLDDGFPELLRALSTQGHVSGGYQHWFKQHPCLVYFGLLTAFLSLGLFALSLVLPWQALSLVVLVVAIIPLSDVAVSFVNKIVAWLVFPRVLPRYDWKVGIPVESSAFVVIPALIHRQEHVDELLERLEQHYLANPDPQLWYALLTDFTDSPTQTTKNDAPLIKHLLAGVERLNARYASEGQVRFFVFHRERQWNPSENCWMGWERKRGKLDEFNRLLRGDATTSYTVQSSLLPGLPVIRYVLTLDADTVLPRDAARQMIARLAHPLNRAQLSDDGRRVVRGYGVLQPRVSFLYRTGFRSLLARWFAGSTGIDPYSAARSDTYMDLFGNGSFTGKGLYDVDAFSATAGKAFPENRILSHDLIESNYARCGLATDVEVFDEFPGSYLTYAKRDHRWIRGDWQLLPWLMPRVPTPSGTQANVLPVLERWKILDNLRRSLLAPTSFLMIVAVYLLGVRHYWPGLIVAVIPYLLPAFQQFLSILIHSIQQRSINTGIKMIRTELSNTLGQTLVQLAMLPHLALTATDAILRTLYRLLFSRTDLLEWETSSTAERRHQNTLAHTVRVLLPTLILVFGVVVLLWFTNRSLVWASPLLILWLISPWIAYIVSQPLVPADQPLNAEERQFLEAIIAKIWHFFETFVGDTDHWLPPDNFQEYPCGSVAHRTSPTNIGVYLLSTLTAFHFKLVTVDVMIKRLGHAFDTLESLPRYQGHFLNWYDTRTLTTLRPEYVSTVDSGNLLACLLALKNGLRELADAQSDTVARPELEVLAQRSQLLADAMDFRFLYNKERDLFSIGFNVDLHRLDPNHYDLLASEACIASYLAIALGQVPRKHWFQLGRLFTNVGHRTGLVSWGGTMFEYLMPRLLLPTMPGILLEQSQQAAVERQIDYGRELHLPWGISESAYYAFDGSQQYQYQSFGVPHLGLKRGLSRDRVIAPYATLLAVDVTPVEAIANLKRITREGGEGEYGYYEAIDYTKGRIPVDATKDVIRTYMAHHQGMGLLAIANRLRQGMIRGWLHAEPAVRAAELLLEERVPHDVPVTEAESVGVEQQLSAANPAQSRRRIVTADTPVPRTHLISNGRYSVMVTNAGTGFSRYELLDITRWRADPTADKLGTFVYLRNRREGTLWSTTHQPVHRRAEEFEVIFAVDKADFHRRDEEIDTLTEVTVVPDTDVEIRLITLTNLGRRSKHLDVTSYAEIVLGTSAEDQAHPAFGKLFLETEWLPQHSALLCRRRPRSPEQKPIWAVHVLASEDCPGSVSFETDRARFLGRRRDVSRPLSMEPECRHLSGTTGAVLDPIFSIRRSLKIRSGEKAVLAFTTGYAESREAALALADRFHSLSAVHRGFELAWAHTRIDLQHAHLEADDVHLFQKLAGHLLYPVGPLRASAETLNANTLGQAGLWGYGISGDIPLAAIRLHGTAGLGHLKQMVQAHEYWRKKGLRADLLVLCENAGGYYDEACSEAINLIRSMGLGDRLDQAAGIFVRKGGQIPEADRTLLLSCAGVIVDDRAGPIHLQGTSPLFATPQLTSTRRSRVQPHFTPMVQSTINALPNSYGGFSADELEYVIQPNTGEKIPPMPWSNVVANPDGGFLITDSGGGFTWAGNSQLNRLTPWSNDPVSDPPGEAIYIQDLETGTVWNPTPLPIRDEGQITVSHGQGYTSFQRIVHQIDHDLTLAMPEHDAVKISILQLRHRGNQPVKLAITYYVEWVLGTHRGVTLPHLVTFNDGSTHDTLFARNHFNPDYPEAISFVATSLQSVTSTGNRAEFLGRNQSMADPVGLYQGKLSGQTGPGLDACAALRGEVTLQPGEVKTIVFLLGQAANLHTAHELIERYRSASAAAVATQVMITNWDNLEERLQVHTPDPSFDLLMNHWLLYQVLSCRMWGRSACFQSGGAFGFRDQLQDAMALVYSRPELVRAHLLRAASRQFVEGDVQHWWHEPRGFGVRTQFSDDFLWLPFVSSHYVEVTGDRAVLDEIVPFIMAEPLPEGVHERYGPATVSETSASLYEHCVRALNHGWKLGIHGLPLMGCGDWNDGMNRVGIEGKGESIWVAWFQISCLNRFAEIARFRGEETYAQQCQTRAAQLRDAVEQHGYDDAWYRRAYFDDGTPLGSSANEACQIDSIAQSWAVLSEAGSSARTQLAMDEVMKRLVHSDKQLVQLFDPPFDAGTLEPGYIKGYLPGIRENGGQYTHAACWVVQALVRLGRKEEAWQVYDMISPVRLTQDAEGVQRYQGEPYVIAADVYDHPQHIGHAGWTWYTGSASWYYRVGLEEILGFRLRGNRLQIAPSIPSHWPSFRIVYRYGGNTTYHIEVQQHEPGKDLLLLDGRKVAEHWIPLIDDGREHEIQLGCQGKAEEHAA